MSDYEGIALFTPAEGRADAVAAALAGLVAPSRAEAANCGYTVRRVDTTPPRYAVLERYRDRAGFEAHRDAPHTRAVLDRADELLAAPPEVLYLDPEEVRPDVAA
jgi:quinol monooxygenase YgiN